MCRVYVCVYAGENENKNLKLFFLTSFFVFVNLLNILFRNKLGSYFLDFFELISSVQLFSCVWLQSHELQHTRPPCPSAIPKVHPSPCHPLSSPFPPALNLSQLQSLFKWVSSLHQVAKVLEFQLQPRSFQWIFRVFPLGLTGLISLLSKGLTLAFSNTIIQKHQFFSAQPSLWSNSHIHTWLLEKP